MRRFFATFLCIIPIAHLGSAFASLDNKTCSSGSQECRSKSLVVDLEKLKESVLSGRVYQHENFLNEEEIQILVDDIDRLTREKKMMPSGLSNTNKGGNQQFGESDRTTCPVPWWVDSLQGNTLTFGTDSDEDSAVLNRVSNKIQDLRHCVASVLKRPTMKEAAYEHECYYSRSTVGASLKRHMDERHEETKGPRGWIQPSRRSVSWLIYLSDANIQGGELRSLVKKNFDSDQLEVGSHAGNLQVGWLDFDDSSTLPVYLNSWYTPPGISSNNVEPFCILYTIIDGEEQFISKPWINAMDTSFADFINAQKLGEGPGLFTSSAISAGFKLLEDRQIWDAGLAPPGSVLEDVAPKRGSLVMFDSATVPHEVLAVKEGVRPALAGWFHEQTQQIPEGFF